MPAAPTGTVGPGVSMSPSRAALWPALAAPAGAAGSTLTTALAAAVAGREADLALQPLELALRVALLLVAPCLGALVAALVLPRPEPPAIARLTVVGVGLGVPVGPVLALRLERVLDFGLGSIVLTLLVMAAWAVVGAALAAGWWSRPERYTERTELPGSDPLG
jgi:hypothetical protein